MKRYFCSTDDSSIILVVIIILSCILLIADADTTSRLSWLYILSTICSLHTFSLRFCSFTVLEKDIVPIFNGRPVRSISYFIKRHWLPTHFIQKLSANHGPRKSSEKKPVFNCLHLGYRAPQVFSVKSEMVGSTTCQKQKWSTSWTTYCIK